MTILARVGRRKGPDGKPIVTYGFRFWHAGRLYKKMVGRSRTLAVEAEKRMRARLEASAFEAQYGPVRPRLTSWDDALDQYRVAKAAKRSLAFDEYHLAWWGSWFAGQNIRYLQSITPQAIDAAKVRLAADGKAAATVQRYLSTLRNLCNVAKKRWGVLQRNPVEAVDWPKARPRTFKVPTPEDVRALLTAADPILYPVILTAVYTGLRAGDILRLTAEDLRERPGWIKGYGSKPGRPVWLPVVPELKAALDALGVISGRLFRRPDGTPFRLFPRDRWNACRSAATLPAVRFHDLRHCVGSLLAEAGVPQRVIQTFLGHASGAITERYTRPRETGLQRASRALAKRLGPRRNNPPVEPTSS